KSFRWTGLLFLIYFLLTSCVERKEERGLCDGKNLNELKSEIDIFRQKVKEDNYALDPLRLKFNEILLEKKSEGTYMLQVHCDLGSTNTNEINNYYFILSIYPYDNDIEMLNKDRIKYGFEMFSM